MHFTREPDLESIAHLVVDVMELEEAIRDRYLPAARRLASPDVAGPRALADTLGFALRASTGYEGSLAGIRSQADAILDGRHHPAVDDDARDALPRLQVASAKYLALLDFTRPAIEGSANNQPETATRLLHQLDLAAATMPYFDGTPMTIYILLSALLRRLRP
jgi:hypothetical protein